VLDIEADITQPLGRHDGERLCNLDSAGGSVDANRLVAAVVKLAGKLAGSTTDVQNCLWCRRIDEAQELADLLGGSKSKFSTFIVES
jgi:hypothetical protein